MTDSIHPTKVPEGLATAVYKDALSPSVQEVGGVLHQLTKTLLSPMKFTLRTVEQTFEYVDWRVTEILNERMVPPEQRVAPPTEILEPVILALRNPEKDATLREMYLRLLATAMDASHQEEAHPAFARVLQDMTPAEAKLFTIIDAVEAPEPLRLFAATEAEPAWDDYYNDVGAYMAPETVIGMRSFENLHRLGLIYKVKYGWESRDELRKRLGRRSELCRVFGRDLIGDSRMQLAVSTGIVPASIDLVRSSLPSKVQVSGVRLTGFGREFVEVVHPIDVKSFLRLSDLRDELTNFPAGIHG